jgi:flagellar protein FliO/FliZ
MDSVELVGRVLVSLVVILAVIWVLGRKFRKGGKAKGAGLIDVLGRQQLSRTASVAVVRIGSQALVVGITDTQVNVLGETDLVAALAEVSVAAPAGSTRVDARRNRPSGNRPAPSLPAGVAAAVAPPSIPAPPRADTAAGAAPAAPRGPLAGSALSPATWRQTIESLRDLTAH